MNKFTLALALGTGLTLCLAAPAVKAAPIIQTLSTPEMSASQFNSLFTPMNTSLASSSPFEFVGSPVSGQVASQVFQGTGSAQGLYAYVYQLAVNNVKDSNGNPVHVDSAAWNFNATPIGTDFTNTGHSAFGYVIKDGPIGGLVTPVAAPGETIQVPTTLSWQPQGTAGTLRVQYVDPATQTHPLDGGAKSAAFVVISDQAPTSKYVSLQGSGPLDPSAGYSLASVYSPQDGKISPVPVPEPATFLAWAGMAGGIALVRHVRKNRSAL